MKRLLAILTVLGPLANSGCSHVPLGAVGARGRAPGRPRYRRRDTVAVVFRDNVSERTLSFRRRVDRYGEIGLPVPGRWRPVCIVAAGKTRPRLAWDILLTYAKAGAFRDMTVTLQAERREDMPPFELSLELNPDVSEPRIVRDGRELPVLFWPAGQGPALPAGDYWTPEEKIDLMPGSGLWSERPGAGME